MQSQDSNKIVSSQTSVTTTASSSGISSISQSPLFPPSEASPSNPIQPQESNMESDQTHDTNTGSIGNVGVANRTVTDEPDIQSILYDEIMSNAWGKVVETYEKYKEAAQTARITRSKKTALHMAMSYSRNDEVEKLLNIIDDLAIREMTDDRGETPLHLAASLGQVKTCNLLVTKDMELIEKRNVDGETPLFLAARHGKKGAFDALHPNCSIARLPIRHHIQHCRKNDGDTILHVSIQGAHFGLAFQIINWYPELSMCFNETGQTALHLLAQNPSAFRSGCHLGPIDAFIYRCLIVDTAKVLKPSDSNDEHYSDITPPVMGNYKCSLDLLKMWKKLVSTIDKWKERTSDEDDVEKQQLPCGEEAQSPRKGKDQGMEPNQGEAGTKGDICKHSHLKVRDVIKGQEDVVPTQRPPDSPDYFVFFRLLQFMIELLLSVLGLGFFWLRVPDIKEKKQNHKYTNEIMIRLVKDEKFKESGSMPPTFAKPEDMDVDKPPEKEGPHENQSGSMPPAFPTFAKPEDMDVDKPPEKEGPHENQSTEKTMAQYRISNILTDGEKWKEMMEPIRNFDELMQKLIPGIQRKEVVLEAVYGYKMPEDSKMDSMKQSSPFLIAVKMGVKEIVDAILVDSPMAIHLDDADEKNAVLLAVENKHPDIYELLKKKYDSEQYNSIYRKVDINGNNAFHLAATVGEDPPWRIPGTALQIEWELKWYKHITRSMPHELSVQRNRKGQTSTEVFNEKHKDMVKKATKWLTDTAGSCSVVAALIVSVAYATATTVPGGVKDTNGIPILRGHLPFNVFTITSLVALSLSVTSLTMFLSILTSRYQISDFLHNLPMKLILGLTSLFISIAAMLVSFCAGHFYDLNDQLRHTAFPIYAIACLPISLYAVTQFPLYFDLLRSITTTIPIRDKEHSTI